MSVSRSSPPRVSASLVFIVLEAIFASKIFLKSIYLILLTMPEPNAGDNAGDQVPQQELEEREESIPPARVPRTHTSPAAIEVLKQLPFFTRLKKISRLRIRTRFAST